MPSFSKRIGMSTSKGQTRVRLLVRKDGSIRGIYSDPGGAILGGIAPLRIRRLSHVEYLAGAWEVRVRGRALYRHREREKALAWERRYFERRLSSL